MILDLPIESDKNDDLNRERFVKAIVKEVKSLNDNKSIVIGLYGKWGSGKTSILNLSQKELEEIGCFTTYFNPWRYNDEDILLKELFTSILIAVNQSDLLKSKINELGKSLKKYSKFITVPKVDIWGVKFDVSESAQKLGEYVGELLDNEESLIESKTKINEILNELAVPLIIFIDDIDRLNKKEVRQLFKLIKLSVD